MDTKDTPRMYSVFAKVPRYAWSKVRLTPVIAALNVGNNAKPTIITTTAEITPNNTLSI